MNTGERIKRLRKELGISAEYIAEKIGVSPSTIYRYENNEISSMKVDNLKSIANLLGVDACYLLGWNSDLQDPSAATLSDPEQTLVDNFHQLNEEGQDKLIEYSEDLVSLGKYKKSDLAEVVEETA